MLDEIVRPSDFVNALHAIFAHLLGLYACCTCIISIILILLVTVAQSRL